MFVGIDELHGAGSIEGHKRADFFEALQADALGEVTHTGTFQLEYAGGFARAQEVVGIFVVAFDVVNINENSGGFFDEPDSLMHYG